MWLETNRIIFWHILHISGSTPRNAVRRSLQFGTSSTSGGGSKIRSVIFLHCFFKVSEKQKFRKNRYPRKEHPVWILARSANMFPVIFENPLESEKELLRLRWENSTGTLCMVAENGE
uniref:Uncharacterized protein n=1 Tax=Candidatus Kentrum sp. TC TaxID=2126339 RepID=A0A450YP40_9GAMM|nr:MAG: hypothetical protein BECKTC1821D_GA0114238_101622 [Candidatus Kentron sp. TC]